MLEIKNIKKVKTELFSDDWGSCWHGMCMLKACRASADAPKRKNIKKKRQQIKDRFGGNILRASEAERHAFLSIMEHLKSETVSMFELGAGRGDWVLATAGTIKHQLVPTNVEKCRCLAIEGEPTHFKWTKKHIEKHEIDCVCLHGAITKKPGHCEFMVAEKPSDTYGQSIAGSKKKNRKTTRIQAYTVDQLMEMYDFPKLDFIHMDIQGQEYNALLGARKGLENSKIDYLLICTHGSRGRNNDKMNLSIKQLMKQYDYKIALDIPPKNLNRTKTVLGDAVSDGDGFMMFISNKAS